MRLIKTCQHVLQLSRGCYKKQTNKTSLSLAASKALSSHLVLLCLHNIRLVLTYRTQTNWTKNLCGVLGLIVCDFWFARQSFFQGWYWNDDDNKMLIFCYCFSQFLNKILYDTEKKQYCRIVDASDKGHYKVFFYSKTYIFIFKH